MFMVFNCVIRCGYLGLGFMWASVVLACIRSFLVTSMRTVLSRWMWLGLCCRRTMVLRLVLMSVRMVVSGSLVASFKVLS